MSARKTLDIDAELQSLQAKADKFRLGKFVVKTDVHLGTVNLTSCGADFCSFCSLALSKADDYRSASLASVNYTLDINSPCRLS